MGCNLPQIHIEWDEEHAAGLGPELRTYRQIVNRLGSHEGVETSLNTEEVDEGTWESEPSDAPIEQDNEQQYGDDECDDLCDDECEGLGVGGILHDVRAMCRSLGRLRDLGATVTIDGREATVAALDAYEDTLAREVCRVRLNDHSDRAGNGASNGGCLSSIIYVVGLAVVLQWFFSCG